MTSYLELQNNIENLYKADKKRQQVTRVWQK